MYEAATGEKLYSGLTSAQIIMRVVFEGLRPSFSDRVCRRFSHVYRDLAVQCWEENPAQRPLLGDLLRQLEERQVQIRAQQQQGTQYPGWLSNT